MSDSNFYYENKDLLLSNVQKIISETDVVLEIGCGIAPMNYFRPRLHIMIEPWKEYADIMAFRHKDDSSVFIINNDALAEIKNLMDNSVDSIFLIDVIEHMDKDTGLKVISHCERIARKEIIIFTPLGFMPQHMDKEDKDAWGLSGTSVQEHLSGWLPEDFVGTDWKFHICEKFHNVDFKGDPLEIVYGAFFAIRNTTKQTIAKPSSWSDLRKPLPSEQKLELLQNELGIVKAQLEAALKIANHPLVKAEYKFFKLIRSFLSIK